MRVYLTGITTPTAETGCSTAQELVAYYARVSNPANQANHTTGAKLMRTLIREHHWSPLEMVNLTIGIETTRDIARQILRHRSFSFQEFSQRYAVATQFIHREARLQDTKNRQNSIPTDDVRLQEQWRMKQAALLASIEEDYEWALQAGIAKEQARVILPEGLTVSSMYMQGSLRSWMHYCILRRGNGTQLEHIHVADACWSILEQHFPQLTQAVLEM